ncbi:MAG: hypothetical protein HY553_16900, partial [Elusimicrobia bacterium]|nr:hypothetical protein [Elusimicrobiota bacterium]
CRTCHEQEGFRVENKKIYDYFQEWKDSPHDRAGLSCTACHGGDAAKADKDEAHRGIVPTSNAASPLHFKNIPATCGGCHPEVLARFEKSRHFEKLKAKAGGPNCVTCHGSLDAKIYAQTVVDRSCLKCHNAKSRNHPEVAARAREILAKLNHADGYRKGLKFYYKSIGRPEAMKKVDAAYQDIVHSWHEFDFKRLGPRAEELLRELKALYTHAQDERKHRPEEEKP